MKGIPVGFALAGQSGPGLEKSPDPHASWISRDGFLFHPATCLTYQLNETGSLSFESHRSQGRREPARPLSPPTIDSPSLVPRPGPADTGSWVRAPKRPRSPPGRPTTSREGDPHPGEAGAATQIGCAAASPAQVAVFPPTGGGLRQASGIDKSADV